ncbi:MAG: SMP-30/gluconolactonase/LRE family protein [Neomegalonema sp.]|nr:SMP-30/gluconolactonase/LRE family protein [Neomegalonema sp.]
MRRALLWSGFGAGLLLAALVFAPGPIDPVAWTPPVDRGLTGPFAPNKALHAAQKLDLGDYSGPESAAVAPDGALYVATVEGAVVKLREAGGVELLFSTGGRPLGLAIAPNGDVYVADAYRGLLRWSAGKLEVLVDQIDGAPLRYANAVALASDGAVYFTQSTQRFDPAALGSTLEASILDIAEHRRSGRLLVWRPAVEASEATAGVVEIVAAGFSFANGVALAADESYAVVVETGAYRLWKVALGGDARGRKTPLIENLPGFPDNVARDPSGDVFWVGVGSLRRSIADVLADAPGLRSVVFKLPDFVRPGPAKHGVVFAVGADGSVRTTLQDPTGKLGLVSGAVPFGDSLAVTVLDGGALYRTSAPTWRALTGASAR